MIYKNRWLSIYLYEYRYVGTPELPLRYVLQYEYYMYCMYCIIFSCEISDENSVKYRMSEKGK